MKSCIYIDGWALWAVIGMFLALVYGSIMTGSAYLRELKENERLRRRNRHLRTEYSLLLGEYHRKLWKLPETEEKDVNLP